MREITRDSLHSSLKAKPKEIQDKFLEVANYLIRKGSNTSIAIQEANKAVDKLEQEIAKAAIVKQELKQKENKVALEKALSDSIQIPLKTNTDTLEDPQVDPEEIQSIYFDNDGKLNIKFGDGFTLKSKNASPSIIEQRTAIATPPPFFDWVKFNTELSTPEWQEGLLFYDKNSHSLSYYNDRDGITVNIGQEQLLAVYNTSGTDIPDGAVVYVNGSYLKHPTVALASCSVKEQAYGVIGVATISIPNGSHGYVCIAGNVNGINTSSYTAGQTLYLGTSPGSFTATLPMQPNYDVIVAQVTNVGTTDGSVTVRVIRNPWFPSLQLLHPAASTTLPTTPTVFKPSDTVYNDGFSYDSSTGEITFTESGDYTFTIQFNAYPSASNKNIYFYAEEYYNGVWTIGRYTARQIRLVNQVEDQVQITAARYVKVGTKFRFYIWGDATVSLHSTDLPGTTPGTVTLPAFRLNIA